MLFRLTKITLSLFSLENEHFYLLFDDLICFSLILIMKIEFCFCDQ